MKLIVLLRCSVWAMYTISVVAFWISGDKNSLKKYPEHYFQQNKFGLLSVASTLLLVLVLVITEWMLLAEFRVLARWLEICNLQRAMACRSLMQNAKRFWQLIWPFTHSRLPFPPCCKRWEEDSVDVMSINNRAVSHSLLPQGLMQTENYIQRSMCA